MSEISESSEEYPDVALSLPKPRVTEGGITQNKKKRKSGAKELLNGIKKRPTSAKIVKNQMKFTTTLAEFEEVCDEIGVMTADIGASFLCKLPDPVDWIANPTRQPHWSTLEGKSGLDDEAGSVSSSEYQAFADTDQTTKISKLSDCTKHVRIEASGSTLRSAWGRVLTEAARGGGVAVAEAQPGDLPHSALAFRRVPAAPKGPRKESEQTETARGARCLRFLYVVPDGAGDAGGAGRRQLAEHLAARRHMLHGQITLIVLDPEHYCKNGDQKEQLEMALIDVVVSLEVDHVVVHSAEELAELVLQFVKALAEEPAKLAKRAVDEQADFYMRGHNKNCVTVDQQGNGLRRLWQQMLAVLPNSSLEVSRALVAAYPSPRLLAEATSTPAGVRDLVVSRSTAPGARGRRLGPEMEHKLHSLFNTIDGELLVE